MKSILSSAAFLDERALDDPAARGKSLL